jgi:hypothetical protein
MKIQLKQSTESNSKNINTEKQDKMLGLDKVPKSSQCGPPAPDDPPGPDGGNG